MNVFFLARVASKMCGERCIVYPAYEPGGLACARMGEGERAWHIVIDPRIAIHGDPSKPSLLWALSHEIAHIKLGHCARRHISEREQAERVARIAELDAQLGPASAARSNAKAASVNAQQEREANAWADENAPLIELWCQRTYGRDFDDLAINGF